MSVFAFVVLIFTLSLVGMALLVGIHFFSIRKLSAEQLREELVSRGAFFEEFAGVMRFFKKIFSKFYVFLRKRFGQTFLKKYSCHFSNFVRGRYYVEKNGCEGYWKEVNKNNISKEE